MGVAAPGHLLLLFSGQLSPQVNVTAPEFFPIFREEDSISIRKVPIYDRYSNILEGADNGKLSMFRVASFKRYDKRRGRLSDRSAPDAYHRQAGKQG